MTLLRGALFSVTMGSNDFINNYLTPIFGVPERAVTPPEVFVDALISKYREQLIVSAVAGLPQITQAVCVGLEAAPVHRTFFLCK